MALTCGLFSSLKHSDCNHRGRYNLGSVSHRMVKELEHFFNTFKLLTIRNKGPDWIHVGLIVSSTSSGYV